MKIPCCAKKLIATFFSSYDRKLDRKLTMLSLKLNDLKIKNEVEKKGKQLKEKEEEKKKKAMKRILEIK